MQVASNQINQIKKTTTTIMQIRSQEVGKKSLEKIYLNEYLRLYSSKMS